MEKIKEQEIVLNDGRKLLDSEFGMPAAKAVLAIALAFVTAVSITIGSEYMK